MGRYVRDTLVSGEVLIYEAKNYFVELFVPFASCFYLHTRCLLFYSWIREASFDLPRFLSVPIYCDAPAYN